MFSLGKRESFYRGKKPCAYSLCPPSWVICLTRPGISPNGRLSPRDRNHTPGGRPSQRAGLSLHAVFALVVVLRSVLFLNLDNHSSASRCPRAGGGEQMPFFPYMAGSALGVHSLQGQRVP